MRFVNRHLDKTNFLVKTLSHVVNLAVASCHSFSTVSGVTKLEAQTRQGETQLKGSTASPLADSNFQKKSEMIVNPEMWVAILNH